VLEELYNWILEENHHKGYEDKVEELR
jgi:hypothetical protein